ncbi:MAG: hypothetical protein GX660_03635, partial [Clostridiaceae bacterium]|nr:hypothetical protein [Clostridiaceae bacterium]
MFNANVFASENIPLANCMSGTSAYALHMFRFKDIISDVIPLQGGEKSEDESGYVHNLIRLHKTNYKSKQRALYLEKEEYNHYYGLLHSQTGFTDGSGTPEDAYRYARDEAKLDYFAVTDHSNLFDNEFDWKKSEKWAKTKAIANSYNVNNKFVALAGFEMSWYNGNGHINTINTDWFVSSNDPNMDLRNYYKLIAADKASITQWNHPGTYYGHFQNFAYYSPEV